MLLNDTYASFPTEVKKKPMGQSIFDDGGLVIRRGLLYLVYLKLKTLLHRKYLILARTHPRFAYSRNVCIEAALNGLCEQEILEQETLPGGRCYIDRWKLSSPLIKTEYLLATTILCVDIDHDLKMEATPGQEHLVDLTTRQRAIEVLKVSYRIWNQVTDRSEEAKKASAAIEFVLAKAGQLLDGSSRSHKALEHMQQEVQPYEMNGATKYGLLYDQVASWHARKTQDNASDAYLELNTVQLVRLTPNEGSSG